MSHNCRISPLAKRKSSTNELFQSYSVLMYRLFFSFNKIQNAILVTPHNRFYNSNKKIKELKKYLMGK